MGSYALSGCKWLTIVGTTANHWPLDGLGAGTPTNTLSLTASAKRTTVYGILITVTAAGNIIIANHAETALTGHTIAVTATTVVPQYIPLGGPEGLEFPTGISASASAAGITFTVYFDQVQ